MPLIVFGVFTSSPKSGLAGAWEALDPAQAAWKKQWKGKEVTTPKGHTCSISLKPGGACQGSVSLHPHTRAKVVPTGESVLLPSELELGELMETNQRL